jgi:hypothetical protein
MVFILMGMNAQLVYDFNKNANPREWMIVDDVVMGGRSNGRFYINSEGNGVFTGTVSTENNGGFSSVRHSCNNIKTSKNGILLLHIKGDSKSYQVRIKDKLNTYFSYVTTFKTSGDWEIIEIPLNRMYPSFRGRTLNLPNFEANTIEEIAFLIGNKKNESFTLLIDKIELK